MSATYTPDQGPSRPFTNAAIAVLATAAIFAILPFLSLMNEFIRPTTDPSELVPDKTPPQVIEPPKPPLIEQIELPKPKLEEPLKMPDLHDWERALVPGHGVGYITSDWTGGFVIDTDIGGILDINEVDKRPTVLVQSKPTYPYSMQQSKTRGMVMVEFVIDASGKVIRPRVVSSTHKDFESAAIDAVTRSSYRPAIKNGEPVAVRTKVSVEFKP